MKNFSAVALLFLFPLLSISQGVAIYSVSRQTGIAYNSISATGNSITSWRAGANLADNRSFPVPIGFSFNYLGTTYSQVSVSLNGFIDFSSNGAGGNTEYPYGYNNNYFSQPSPNGTVNALAPYYEDIMCSVGNSLANSVKYLTTGISGNRVFTVEWINMAHQVAPYDQKVNFQVKLYEIDGDIEFVYGSMSGSGVLLSYTTGINTATLVLPPTPQQLLTQQVPNTTTFNNTPQNALDAIPEPNSRILFDGCILPSAAGTISGPASVCDGTAGVIFSVPAITNATGYAWALPAGFTITSGSNTNSITVTIGAFASSGDVIVNGINSCGSGDPSSKAVTVNIRPVPTISGNPSTCEWTSGYAYTTQTGMTGYIWTISPGGTILSGSGTNYITVSWTSAGPQNISVSYTNSAGCTAAAPTLFPVQVNPRPVPTITGPSNPCVNATGNIYTTEPGMTNYAWAISPGGTITAGGTAASNTVTVTWTTVGNRYVSVNYTNANGCQAFTPLVYPVTVNPLPQPEIYGPTSVCAASTGNVYTTQSGMTGYIWNISPGGTFTSGTNTNLVTVTWNTTGIQYITVNYSTLAGCIAAVPDTLYVTVNSRPVPTITGPATVCAGTGGHVYTTQGGMTNYQWALSSGGTIITGLGTNTVSVAWATAGIHNVLVNYSNAAGCNALTPTAYPVTVKPQPVPSLSGPTPVCTGISGNQYLTDGGMINYIWNLSPGNTVTAGGTSGDNYITVTWNVLDTQHVYVNYTDPNGCIAQTASSYAVMVNALPVPSITGPDTVCVSTGGHIYTTQPGQVNYTWAVSAGGSITAGTGTNFITVSWNVAGAQSVSVNFMNSNGCSAPVPTLLNIQVDPLPVPVITGPATACQGVSGNVYSTAAGMSNYQWSVSSGGTVTGGGTPASNTVTVTWDSAGARTVSVGYTNANGCTSAAPTVKNVTVYPLPVPSINGPASVCANSGNYGYSTQNGMTGYQWQVSSGGTITSGAGTYAIQVTWFGIGAQWVSVNYTNVNGCSAATPVTLSVFSETIPGAAGPVTGTGDICGPETGVAYSVDPINGATSYIWSVPPGATIASGAGTPLILVDYAPNASSGNVSVTGTNFCGNGATSPLFPVTFTPIPPRPVISQQGDLLISDAPAGNQWYLEGTPIPGANAQTYFVQVTGDYYVQVTINDCASDTSYHVYVVITGTEVPPEIPIHLYPNPNDGMFVLKTTSLFTDELQVILIDLAGETIAERTIICNKNIREAVIDVRPIPAGVYLLKASGKAVSLTRKILILP